MIKLKTPSAVLNPTEKLKSCGRMFPTEARISRGKPNEKKLQVLLTVLLLVSGLGMSKAAFTAGMPAGLTPESPEVANLLPNAHIVIQDEWCATINCNCCSNSYDFFCVGACPRQRRGTCMAGMRTCSCGWHCETSICVPPGYCD